MKSHKAPPRPGWEKKRDSTGVFLKIVSLAKRLTRKDRRLMILHLAELERRDDRLDEVS